MVLDCSNNKSFRLLSIYERLLKGDEINKRALADEYGITAKSIQRDIDDLRSYICETHFTDADGSIVYDRRKNTYRLVKIEREWLTADEVLAISKILLESRSLSSDEMKGILNKLLSQALPETRQTIKAFILSDICSYSPPKHGKNVIQPLWELTEYIKNQKQITFTYKKQDLSISERTVNPVAIMFSEYYFYLAAYDVGSSLDCPKNFRIDRIENLHDTGKKFQLSYSKHFKDGEYKQRIQFMYPGQLFTVRFRFTGDSLEAVLDRLPTAKVVKQDDTGTIIEAEIFGEGVKRWLLSQKSGVEVLHPQWFREEIKEEITKMKNLYK